MAEGGVRQLVIPPDLGYPSTDPSHEKVRAKRARRACFAVSFAGPQRAPRRDMRAGPWQVGPRPSTFSGQRALDFVLGNRDLIDKTLLINVKLVRVDK